jgi:hypothetical protein
MKNHIFQIIMISIEIDFLLVSRFFLLPLPYIPFNGLVAVKQLSYVVIYERGKKIIIYIHTHTQKQALTSISGQTVAARPHNRPILFR